MLSANKKEKKNARADNILNFLGVFMLAVGIMRIAILLMTANPRHLVWFSNHVMLLLGIGVLMRKRFLVTAELCIALIPETLWSIDFLGKILFNKYIFGVTQYIFEPQSKLLVILSLQHLLIVPLGLVALWFLGVSNRAWKGSLLHASALWILGFFIGQEYNISCVFRYCLSYFKNLGNYMIMWPLIMAFVIVISNLILQGLDFAKKQNYGPDVR